MVKGEPLVCPVHVFQASTAGYCGLSKKYFRQPALKQEYNAM